MYKCMNIKNSFQTRKDWYNLIIKVRKLIFPPLLLCIFNVEYELIVFFFPLLFLTKSLQHHTYILNGLITNSNDDEIYY